MEALIGWFMIITGIAVGVLFVTIAMGDENEY